MRWGAGDRWQVRFDLEVEPTVELAVQELAEFAMDSCGVRIVSEPGDGGRGVIRFGHDATPGYRVEIGHEEISFIASNAVNLLYAVYDFAEQQLGHCFFEPGRDRCRPVGTVEWSAGVLLAQGAPMLRHRGFIQEYPPDARSRQLADWMARNRMNYLLTWMEYYDQYDPELKDYFATRGVEIESGHHNFEYFVPMGEFYDDHPEYFAEIGGNRVGPSSDDTKLMLSKQICTSNPHVRELLADKICEYAASHPEVSTLSLVPNDGFGWCECQSCTALLGEKVHGQWETVSAHVYQAQRIYHALIDDVSDRVAQRRPDLTISFFAYVNYLHPASDFILRPGMLAHVALYWRCINHSLTEPACPTNSAYVSALDAWDEANRGGQVDVYEYYMGVNLYLSLPMVHHGLLGDEARLISDHGGDGVLTQFHLDNWGAYGLNYYAMARAAWGDTPDVAITRGLEILFGSAAGLAQSFLDTVDRLQRDPVDGVVNCLIPVPRLVLSQRSRSLFNQALSQAEQLAQACPDEPLAATWLAWARFLLGLKDAFDANASGQPAADQLHDLLDAARRDEADGLHYAVTAKVELLFSRWLRSEAAGQQWCHSGMDWEDRYILEREAEMIAAAGDSRGH